MKRSHARPTGGQNKTVCQFDGKPGIGAGDRGNAKLVAQSNADATLPAHYPLVNKRLHRRVRAGKLDRFIRKMKKWIVLAVLGAAGAGGIAYWNHIQRHKTAGGPVDRPTTATVEMRDISFSVNAAGEISPAEQVSVRPEINGLIESLP